MSDHDLSIAGIGVTLASAAALVLWDAPPALVLWATFAVGAAVTSYGTRGFIRAGSRSFASAVRAIPRLRITLKPPGRKEVDLDVTGAPLADEAELIQFVNAWMMPAWQKATEVLIPIRGEVKRKHGERIEALLQLGVIDTAIPTWRAVQERIKGERGGNLDELAAAMYEKYELVVRWIYEAGDMVGQPWSDSRRFRDWQAEDAKLLDHLRDFVAKPAAASGALSAARLQAEEGGKSVRERLATRPWSGRPEGVG